MIDYEKLRQIADKSEHTYYERNACRFQRWDALALQIDDVMGRVCKPSSHVLDIGCGDGATLLRNAARFAESVGLDNDALHLDLAEADKAELGVKNVRFVEGRADNLPFEPEAFDLVYSERGPLAGSDVNTVNAVRVLRPGGVMLVETPGALAYFEPGYIFNPDDMPLHKSSVAGALDHLSAVLSRNGVAVQLASSHIEKWVFDDVYEWFKFHLSAWEYYPQWRFDVWPLPERHRHGLERFMRLTADRDGRVTVTQHRLWVGGVKR